jgi:hypothetical protein
MISRSNCAKDGRTFKVERPIEVVVLNCCVTENKGGAPCVEDPDDLGKIGERAGPVDLVNDDDVDPPAVRSASSCCRAPSPPSVALGKFRRADQCEAGWSLWPVTALSAVENDLTTRFGPEAGQQRSGCQILVDAK